MILRRYGAAFHSVQLNFDSRALTEVGFRRDGETQVPTDEFEARYEKVEGHELEATAEGHVHDEVERELLGTLESRIQEILSGLDDDEILVVESQQGPEYPRTRARQRNVHVEGENRLHFTVWIDPPLRVAVYRRRR